MQKEVANNNKVVNMSMISTNKFDLVENFVKPDVVKVITYLKKNLDNVEDEPSSQCYTKIKLNNKLFWYLKNEIKKTQVLSWNQIKSKSMYIENKNECKKLLAEVKIIKRRKKAVINECYCIY